MAIYTYNNITFNNVKKTDEGLKFEANPIVIDGLHTESGDTITNIDLSLGGVINAVDIDWNGANPGID